MNRTMSARTISVRRESRSAGSSPAVSVLVPVTERPASLAELYREFAAPLRARVQSFEFIFLAEPWFKDEMEAVHRLAEEGEPVRVIEPGQRMGETSLLKMGVAEARAPIVVTLPAYHRVEANALPELVARVEAGADMAVARRWPRKDAWINRFQNRLLHGLLQGLSKGQVHDVACGVRAMRRSVVEQVPLYGDNVRFLPLLAMREGFSVEEIDTPQHARDVRTRVYSPRIYLHRLIDIIGLFFMIRFTDKPLRFFGAFGGVFSLIGGLIMVWVLVERFQGQPMADRPLLLLGVLLFVLGVQAIALGLIGEIIVHLSAPRRRPYSLAREEEGEEPPLPGR